MSEQTTQMAPAPDPVRVLKDTRRTLLQLVANIDAAIASTKEPARSR